MQAEDEEGYRALVTTQKNKRLAQLLEKVESLACIAQG